MSSIKIWIHNKILILILILVLIRYKYKYKYIKLTRNFLYNFYCTNLYSLYENLFLYKFIRTKQERILPIYYVNKYDPGNDPLCQLLSNEHIYYQKSKTKHSSS